MNSDIKQTKKKGIRVPHTMIILVCCVLFMTILTWLVPAGEYDRYENEQGVTVIDPDSYHSVERSPVGIMGFLTSFYYGFGATAGILVLVFIPGGCVAILRKIGLIDSAIESLAHKFKNNRILVIPILMLVFGLIDAFLSMPEMCIIYISIVMPLMFRLGFDSLTTMGTVALGSAAGFSAAITNPYTIGIGQKISELPLYSGWQFRAVVFIVMIVIGMVYVSRYGYKIQKNPLASSVYEEDKEKRIKYGELAERDEGKKMTVRQKIAGIYSLVLFFSMVYGILGLGWDMPELTGIFIAISIGAGVIGGVSSREFCVTFIKGCEDMVIAAVFITIARASSVVMTNGLIIDTIVYYFAKFLSSLPAQITVIGILLMVTLLNFFVSSGSGKAVILFPILAPLADLVGVTRQTTILAYQFGDGFTNMFWPTNGTQGACLGITGVPWNKWAKFYLPLLIIWNIVGIGFLIFAQTISWGPF